MSEEIQELHRQAAKLHSQLGAMVDALPNPLHRALAKSLVAKFHEVVVLLINQVEKNAR